MEGTCCFTKWPSALSLGVTLEFPLSFIVLNNIHRYLQFSAVQNIASANANGFEF